MPRPRKAVLELNEDITEVYTTDTQPEAPLTSHDSMLEDILEDLGADSSEVMMYIYRQSRVGGGNKPMSQLEIMPVDKYTSAELFLYLKENYGGGDYRIHIKRGREFLANKLMSIEAPQKAKSELSDTANFLQTMLDRIEKQHQAMLEHMQATVNPQGSKKEWYQEMLLMKQLFADNAQAPAVNGIAQLRDSIELLQSLGFAPANQENQDGGFSALMEKMAPVITAAVSNPRQGASAPPPQANPINTTANPNRANNMNALIQLGLTQLLTAARKNSNPATYAELVLDTLPEPVIKNYLTAPDALTRLKAANPAIEPLMPWFIELSEHVKALLGMPSTVSDQYDIEGELDDNLQTETNTAINTEQETGKQAFENGQPTL